MTARPARVAPPAVVAIPHEPFTVVPAELGDLDVDARIHHRLHLEHHGNVWRTSDELEPLVDKSGNPAADYPVIALTRMRAQVVISADHEARYALWVARADAQPVALIETAIAPGVDVLPGAPLEVGTAHGDRREVSVIDAALRVTGTIEARAIGDVWLARDKDHHAAANTLAEQTPIHARPEGPVIATSLQSISVHAGATQGTWREVEYRDALVHVRGFVPASVVTDELHVHGTGFGGGFGISDTGRMIIPAHACLFERVQGEVIGVETATLERYAFPPEVPGWWTIYVYSPWGGIQVKAHQLPDGTWESCASGR